jgi:hypothetical protein
VGGVKNGPTAAAPTLGPLLGTLVSCRRPGTSFHVAASGPIPTGLFPMFFWLSLLDKVQPGDKVRFTIDTDARTIGTAAGSISRRLSLLAGHGGVDLSA